MKKKIAYIIFIVILLLLFIWTNKLQTLWLFGMFGIIWLPMFLSIGIMREDCSEV